MDRLLMSFVNKVFTDVFHSKYPGKPLPRDMFFDTKTGEETRRKNKNSFSLYCSFDLKACEQIKKITRKPFPKGFPLQLERTFDYPHKLNSPPTDIEGVSLEDLIYYVATNENLSQALKEKYLTMLDDEYAEKKQKEIIEGFDADYVKASPLFNEEDKETELLHCLYALKYEQEHIIDVVNYYKEDHKDCFPEELLKMGVYKNNRLYLPGINGTYTVISKNPYDYVWAATGNGFQSCFSLESNYWGIQCMPLLATQSWHFMMYESTLWFSEYSLFNHKFKLPNMKVRNWVYNTEEGLMRDKLYGKTNEFSEESMDIIFGLLGIRNETRGYERGDLDRIDLDEYIPIKTRDTDYVVGDAVRKYNTYLDSINMAAGGYLFDVGSHRFTAASGSWTPRYSVQHISFNKDLKLNTELSLSFCAGKLGYHKRCPKSSFLIGADEEYHWTAKYLDRPVKSMAILTFDDHKSAYAKNRVEVSDVTSTCQDQGNLFWVSCGHTIDYSYNPTLDTVKTELKKLQETNPQYDCVLLRIIEKNKMTFQPFYAKKEPYL